MQPRKLFPSLKQRITCQRVLSSDPELIQYCAKSIQDEFKQFFPPELQNNNAFHVERVKKFMEAGSAFFVMLLSNEHQEEKGKQRQPVGLFQLEPFPEEITKIFKKEVKSVQSTEKVKSAQLRNVIIPEKSHRGLGIGKELMKEVEKQAHSLGYFVVSLDVVKPSLWNFYKKSHARGVRGGIADSHFSMRGNFHREKFHLWINSSPTNPTTEKVAQNIPLAPRLGRQYTI